ncbi:MAG TPA: hypothetical protein VF763_12000 [Candidatus Limnocylindrales bacterium]
MAVLSSDQRDLIGEARRGVLVTAAADGRPRPVPVCFVLLDGAIYSPLDEKPKRAADPRSLARVRDLLAGRPAALLVDRWSEDWTRLAWLRLEVTGGLLEPGVTEHERAVAVLRARYPQYMAQRLEERPLLRLSVKRAVAWSAADGARG